MRWRVLATEPQAVMEEEVNKAREKARKKKEERKTDRKEQIAFSEEPFRGVFLPCWTA